MTADSSLYIGLMSGTSMDGIDAALVDFSASRPRVLATCITPWPAGVHQRLAALANDAPCDLRELGRADAAVGEHFAQAALALLAQEGISPAEVAGIGSHGQTLHHDPVGDEAFTLQIGDPNRIAERTGITTVADLRRRDIAAGGQGAPLVSAFHHAYLAEPGEPRAVLNIGGIANLTLLPGDERGVRGFDTGPGNCLMDGWIRAHRNQPFDRDGQWATSGQVHPVLLARLLDEPYFAAPIPKTTGTQHFNDAWLKPRLGDDNVPAADVQATLGTLTVRTICDALLAHQPGTRRLLVCGGGRHNGWLMQQLAAALPGVAVEGSEAAGIDPDHMEAAAFAWLAWRTLAGQPGNLPSVTGARRPVVLGGIYPA